jgi:hypothetical protein
VRCPRSVEGSRQQGEIRLGEFLSPPEQAHSDKEMGKKRTPEFRHRDRTRHGGDDSYGKDADRKSGGPRYPLVLEKSGKPTAKSFLVEFEAGNNKGGYEARPFFLNMPMF